MKNRKKAILIGVGGGTGSGKTSVAKALTREFGSKDVLLIEQDSYYNDIAHMTFEERSLINFDHPDSIDLNYFLLLNHKQKRSSFLQLNFLVIRLTYIHHQLHLRLDLAVPENQEDP